ncbi:MAG TPA: FkbM family methyltransferase, partial [Methylomirabilota bacterium]|nr:FkbM family methyltransferase [Methylomirabilota bacterium]
LKGWKGINIDAMPGSMEAFKKIRPRDINLEIPIGLGRQTLTYYNFEDKAFNGFYDSLPKFVPSKLIDIKKLTTVPLQEILDQHVPENQQIDVLSVDAEWMDDKVLKSNNWEKYKPSVVLVEDLHINLGTPEKSNMYEFLTKKGYQLYSYIPPTIIFIRKETLRLLQTTMKVH